MFIYEKKLQFPVKIDHLIGFKGKIKSQADTSFLDKRHVEGTAIIYIKDMGAFFIKSLKKDGK